jgi:hypothetical protein
VTPAAGESTGTLTLKPVNPDGELPPQLKALKANEAAIGVNTLDVKLIGSPC